MEIEENKYLTTYQKIYLKVCELLGVKIFKKYWHVRGTFNKNFKLDKNNIFQLEMVKREAENFTNDHKTGIFYELFAVYIPFFSFGLLEYFKNNNSQILFIGGIFSSSCLIYHNYAFMVHKYNKIRATSRIKYLEDKFKDKNDIIDDEDDNINNEIEEINKTDNLLHIMLCQRNDFKYYTLCFKNIYDLRLKFTFLDIKKVIAFKNYIYENIKDVDINKLIIIYNTDKFKELYLNFIKIDNQ